VTNHDDGNDGKGGGSDVDCDKHQVKQPMDHLKRLLKEACPNLAYPIRHKLKDCDMMKGVMISGSLTYGMKLEDDPGRSDTMSFPREDAIIIVYGGHPH
jgi:hypothetical protein